MIFKGEQRNRNKQICIRGEVYSFHKYLVSGRFSALTKRNYCYPALRPWPMSNISHNRPDDGGSTDLWNVGNIPVYSALQPRKQPLICVYIYIYIYDCVYACEIQLREHNFLRAEFGFNISCVDIKVWRHHYVLMCVACQMWTSGLWRQRFRGTYRLHLRSQGPDRHLQRRGDLKIHLFVSCIVQKVLYMISRMFDAKATVPEIESYNFLEDKTSLLNKLNTKFRLKEVPPSSIFRYESFRHWFKIY
jgi:hypothetical protein